MELTARELRARAWRRLSGVDGNRGYGTYLLGLLLMSVVVFIGVLALVTLFGGSCIGLFAVLWDTAGQMDPTPLMYAGSTVASALFVFGLLYIIGFAAWGQRAMSIALMRGGLTVAHGVSGWGNGWRMVGLTLWQQTFVFLKLLLLIVPGVRALFSYAMAPYLLIDHPDWTPRACLAESERMMEGHRWHYFCLNFSFIGWWILACLAAAVLGGLATVLLTPYVDAAGAAFYEDLLDRADRARTPADDAGAPVDEQCPDIQ